MPNSNINWKRVTFNNHLNTVIAVNINSYFPDSHFRIPRNSLHLTQDVFISCHSPISCAQ